MDMRVKAAASLEQVIRANRVIAAPLIRSNPAEPGIQNAEGVASPEPSSEKAAEITIATDGVTEIQLSRQQRKKGFFSFPVYTARVKSTLKYHIKPNVISETMWLLIPGLLTQGGPSDLAIECNGSHLTLDNSVARGEDILIPLKGCPDQLTTYSVSLKYSILGSGRLIIKPAVRSGKVSVTSDSSEISLGGTISARSVNVENNHLNAEWSIFNLVPSSDQTPLIEVSVLALVDDYSMSLRAVDYNILLLVIIFSSVFLVESTRKLRLHPMNYLLLGTAVVLFYLITFALAEHVGFSNAYAVASLIIIGMNSLYFRALAGDIPALVMAGLAAFLHTFFFSLLLEKNYALLFGTIGITAVLAIIMLLTRKVDWYNFSSLNAEKEIS
jgi:inner membrane protein involved in colicin E2 resistance